MRETGVSDDRTDGAGFLGRRLGTDFAPERAIAAYDRYSGEQAGQMFGQPPLEHGLVRIGQGRDERLARVECRPAERLFGQRLHLRKCAGRIGREGR